MIMLQYTNCLCGSNWSGESAIRNIDHPCVTRQPRLLVHLSIIAHMSRTPPGHLPEILTVGPASSLHQRFMSSCCSSSCCCSSSSGSSTGGGSSSSSSSGGGVAIQTNLLKLVHPKKVQNRPPTNLNPKSQSLTKLFLNPKPLRNPKPEIQHPHPQQPMPK